MIRDVNLIKHLPSFVQEYREIQGVMNAENPELQAVADTSEKIKDNLFVLSTDEEGIERYEKMFGITPSNGEELFDRQTKVLTKYTNSVTYTLRGLIERLNIICGVDGYTLEMDANAYFIKVGLDFKVRNSVNVVSTMLQTMIPANMVCVCTLKYNTHEFLSQYPNQVLMQFTHEELRDSPIDDNLSASCDNLANYTTESLQTISCENVSTFGMRKAYQNSSVERRDGMTQTEKISLQLFEGTDNFDYKVLNENWQKIDDVMNDGVSANNVRIADVTLIAGAWMGETSPYSQVVTIPTVTNKTQVDLTPSVEQLSIFYNKDLAFVTENDNGVVTVYAIGQKPENDYIIQATLTEVDSV